MLYLAENIKTLRKANDLTQEDLADILNVTPQCVSKWERGETYPDIELLPALANFYHTTIDALIGMARINDNTAAASSIMKAHDHIRDKNHKAAAAILNESLKARPNDCALLSELALSLSLSNDAEDLRQASSLCERILSSNPSEKIRHTTRAAVCYIYWKLDEHDKALTSARHLPHTRESREVIAETLNIRLNKEAANDCLRRLILGDPS
jgi:transcriptional regulator with XRE-family HTH domain